jgi:hypothetical protein
MEYIDDMIYCSVRDCEYTRKYYKCCSKCNKYQKVCIGHFNTGYKCKKCDKIKTNDSWGIIEYILKIPSKINKALQRYIR